MKTGQLSPWTYFLLPCEDALERWFIFLLTKILNIFYVVSFHLLPQVTHKQVCNFINCNKSTTQVSPKSWLLSDIRISYHSVDNCGNLVELWFQKRYPSRHRWVTNNAGQELTLQRICSAWSSSWWSGRDWESVFLKVRNFSRESAIPFSHFSQSYNGRTKKLHSHLGIGYHKREAALFCLFWRQKAPFCWLFTKCPQR